jgi:acetoin:2,6-dichlorophenolindophenol oxidoreductase subunit beta
MQRALKFFQAIHEALDLSMAEDSSVYLMGLGVPDPKGIFGTTLGLEKKYGTHRVMDMPTAENGMTGVAIGSALVGMKPVMMHQRLDFALLAVEQIVNQAAKWHYMFSGEFRVPLVIRLIVGRGWGQGPQHSQSLQSWFAHIPGLKVIMPVTPYDAKGLLISSIEDGNPIIFIEHRWLHNTFGEVPEGVYRVPIGKARIARAGKDATIVATSHMVLEALKAAEMLSKNGIEVEVVDVRTLRPLDLETIVTSVTKTGHLVAADTGWKIGGFGSEIVASVVEQAFDSLKSPPQRIGLADCPIPASLALSNLCYPRATDLSAAVCKLLGARANVFSLSEETDAIPLDVPDASFSGPF